MDKVWDVLWTRCRHCNTEIKVTNYTNAKLRFFCDDECKLLHRREVCLRAWRRYNMKKKILRDYSADHPELTPKYIDGIFKKLNY